MTAEVFLGLGGNIGDTLKVIHRALFELNCLPSIEELRVSRFYSTSPVGGQCQRDYVNAVCKFKTTILPKELLKMLQQIEVSLGKVPKSKIDPRVIDIDILFWGDLCYSDRDLEIPHPRWQERLFVLVPLSDLTDRITLGKATYDVGHLIENFPDRSQQVYLK